MAAIEYSTFEITVTPGTDVLDGVLGTVGGAVQGVTIKEVGRNTYQIIVVHLAA
jgi:hypothetical protein